MFDLTYRHILFAACAIVVGVGGAFALKTLAIWTIHSTPIYTSYIVQNVLTKEVDLFDMNLAAAVSESLANKQAIASPEVVVDESKVEEEAHPFKEVISKGVSPSENVLNVSAKSFIVVDLDTNKAIFERDADRAVPIASITKLMTAIVARQEMDQYDRITIGPNVLATYGSSAQFRSGERFTVEELLYPLLMVSSNDAAEALARGYGVGGATGRKEFIRKMNEWASLLGAYHSYFYDPSGLSKNNVTSARDISLIMRWIAENEPDLLDITLTKVKSVRIHTWVNPTHLLNLTAYRGGKNGYTDEAGRTGAAVFEVNENGKSHRYAVVVLDSKNRDRDMLELLDKV